MQWFYLCVIVFWLTRMRKNLSKQFSPPHQSLTPLQQKKKKKNELEKSITSFFFPTCKQSTHWKIPKGLSSNKALCVCVCCYFCDDLNNSRHLVFLLIWGKWPTSLEWVCRPGGIAQGRAFDCRMGLSFTSREKNY